ncbi:MAG: hypothetical protein S4CHLAM102_03280 [Chlamydiia bacterium]|nr:hypothetical protein [Chlamydiia bacterium]
MELKHILFLIAWLGFGCICYFGIDQSVVYAIPRLQGALRTVCKLFTFMINHTFWAGLLIFTFGIACFTEQWKKYRNRIFFVGIALAASLTVVYLSKAYFGRARPTLLTQTGEYGFYFLQSGHRYHSFPSSHIVTVFSLATAYYCLFRKSLGVVFLVAWALSLTRILLRQHFVSDAVVSSCIAIGVSYAVYLFFARYEEKIDHFLNRATWRKSDEQLRSPDQES